MTFFLFPAANSSSLPSTSARNTFSRKENVRSSESHRTQPAEKQSQIMRNKRARIEKQLQKQTNEI